MSSQSQILVRAEVASDYAAVRRVHQLAFGQPQEAALVDALRDDPQLSPLISLVACNDDQVVGHILFSPITIGGALGMSLAPVGVLPERQRQGIGAALVRAGLSECVRLRQQVVVVVGHPEYYPKFGFQPARAHGLEAPFEVRDSAFMALETTPGGLAQTRGMVRYPAAFDTV